MNDIKFFKSFTFNLFQYKQYHTTDMTNGCPVHYFAKLISGSAKIITADKTLHLKKGDVFYIPKGLRYRSFWYPENENVSFYSFGFEFFPTPHHGFALQKITLNHGEDALLNALAEDITPTPQTIGRLYYLLGEISPRLISDEQSPDKTIYLALDFMRQNEEYSITDVARFCGVSESGLYIKFKKHLGKTPVTVRQEILTERAKELLSNTDLSVEEISDRLGFSSSSYFRKIFYSHTQTTPTAYRKESRNI